MSTTGTNHFISVASATRYYDILGEDARDKIKDGSIKIGPPKCREGEKILINNEGRYVIENNDVKNNI